MHRALELAKSVRRDSHKMKAFVRFRAVPGEDNAFVAWFEPDHFIVDRVAPFFMRRFAGMRWAILTPYRSAMWDGESLTFGDGRTRADAPSDDAQESLWRTYYASIFNPARLNPDMMRQEMAQKYWKLLPEAQLLPTLIRDANQRTHAMRERAPEPTRRRIPRVAGHIAVVVEPGLRGLRQAARACRNCELWQPATQTVFGEGPEDARIMLIGEQPGDEEDLVGRPFVGPSGKLLDRALSELGLDRSTHVRDQCREAFSFRTARQASPASQSGSLARTRVRDVARRRIRADQTRGRRVPRRIGGARDFRFVVPAHRRARTMANDTRRQARVRHGASVFDPAHGSIASRRSLRRVRE